MACLIAPIGPVPSQRQLGLFTLQMIERDPWRFEAGARLEFSKLSSDEDPDLGTLDQSRKFTTFASHLTCLIWV